MSTLRLVLEGLRGLFAEEQWTLLPGGTVTVGRSRSCEISVTSTRAYADIGRPTLERNRGFRRISRRHFQVSFRPGGEVVVEDLSTNGLWLDGAAITRTVLSVDGLYSRPAVLAFGEGERLRLRAEEAPGAEGPRS